MSFAGGPSTPSGFLRWWTTRLGELVPAWLRHSITGADRWFVVDLSGEQPEFARRRGLRDTDRWQAGPGSTLSSLKRTLAGQAKGCRVAVRLAPGQVLRRQIEVPLAVEEDPKSMLEFELDRFTPFAAKDAYFNHDIVARDAEGGRLSLDLSVVPKRVVEEAQSRLNEYGLRAERIEAAQASGETIFVDLPSLPSRLTIWHRGLNWVMLALLVAAGAYLVFRDGADLDQRRAEIASERTMLLPEVETALALREEIERDEVQRGTLLARRRTTPLAVALLDEIAALLPVDSWLAQIELAGGRVEIIGYSPAVADLVNILSRSDMFADVSFESPVTHDSRRNLDQFHLALRVESGGTDP